MEIAEKIKQRRELLTTLNALDETIKSTKESLKTLEAEIVKEAIENMVPEMTIDNEKYKFKYENKIFVKESVSDHSKKVELMRRLTELGYNEAAFFESAYYPAVALRKVWSELSPDTINKFAEDGLIYHETIPSITSRKTKG